MKQKKEKSKKKKKSKSEEALEEASKSVETAMMGMAMGTMEGNY